MALERGRLCSANVSMLIFFHSFLMCQLMKPFPVTDVLLILGCECHLGSGEVGDIRQFCSFIDEQSTSISYAFSTVLPSK